MSPMQAARIEKTLNTQTRVNGGRIMTRRALIEKCVAEGYTITARKNGERVLKSLDGSFYDAENITKIGLDYAENLINGQAA
jgi:hypothetical protein